MELTGRGRQIFRLLCERRRMSVAELAQVLFVSEMTVRRDLTELERQGFVTRYRGGAVARTEGLLPISERMHLEEEEKRALCQRATAYLSDGLTVFVDFSSTCQFLIPHLKRFRDIRLVTNSITALTAAEALQIPCFLIGGEYYAQDMCMLGTAAERNVDDINVDVAFYTTAAISHDGVISDFDLKQTMIRKYVMKNARQNVFLFEKEKFGKTYLYTLCRAEDATAILTADE